MLPKIMEKLDLMEAGIKEGRPDIREDIRDLEKEIEKMRQIK